MAAGLDLFGYYLATAVLADTSAGIGVPKAKVGAGKSVAVQVTGRGGVPASAKAVVVSLGATAATAKTRVTAYRDGAARPATPTLATAGASHSAAPCRRGGRPAASVVRSHSPASGVTSQTTAPSVAAHVGPNVR